MRNQNLDVRLRGYDVKIILALIVFCCLLASSVLAQTGKPPALDMRVFKTLPVLHEGRVKPLGSFARILLTQFSGADHLSGMSAEEWLSMSLFDPAQAASLPVFAVPEAPLRAALGLPIKKDLYSFQELGAGLEKTAPQVAGLVGVKTEDLTKAQAALVHLHENVALYTGLLRSFSAILPLDITLPPRYALKKGEDLNFKTLLPLERTLEADLKKVIARKGADPKAYNEAELALAHAGFQIQNVRIGGARSTVFRVFPDVWQPDAPEWFSPWEILLNGRSAPVVGTLFTSWEALAKAYRQQDAAKWESANRALESEVLKQAGARAARPRLRAENIYRAMNPYFWASGCYFLGGILAFMAGFRRKYAGLPVGLFSIVLGGAGFLLHFAALAARIYILARPPVGTLYESVLFVSLICAALGGLVSFKKSSLLPLAAGLLCAGGLLALAPVVIPSADSLEVLVAVLNTNFWLGTHVVVITIGYGICVFAACLAHLALFFRWEKTQHNVHAVSLAALLFMAVGTVLGGIWADQSWGRFWGWDPKENGALLIVLWLIWVQHGRISSHLAARDFLALTALLNVVVAVSWFGVNLLGVGLHSYGFTSGLAGGLGAFCAFEMMLIGMLWHRAKAEQKGKV